MKKIYISLMAVFGFTLTNYAQNPGLLISEFLQNPSSLDSPFEYVELIATDDIDFSVTPFTVIAANNGSATADGWIEGNSTTYAFALTTGTVSIGDVVYVGGSMMAPTGTILRSINTGEDDGDGGIGNANSSGVFGNGGTADGIAVFNSAATSITSSTVPTDAIFYGSSIGGAFVSAVEGYQVPVNDHYDGGKLAEDDFVALDADLTIATGVFDLVTNEFVTARTFEGGAGTDGESAITFVEEVTPIMSFVEKDLTVMEDAGEINVELEITESNGTESVVEVVVYGSSSAENVTDYVLLDTTITASGMVDEIVTFAIAIEDDAVEEQSEYITLAINAVSNVELGDVEEMFLYITDNDRVIPQATHELNFEMLTSYATGTEGEHSAEIVAFDEESNRLFVANSEANQVDIIDFSDPSVLSSIDFINLDSIGGVNSIAVHDGVVAIAIEAPIAQDPGFVAFFTASGDFLNRLTVGALPDMLTFNSTGSQVVIACEGEPNDAYTVDPNGTIAIIEIDGEGEDAITGLTGDDVTVLDFSGFEADIDDLRNEGVRIFGLDATLSQDLEPEFVTILDGDETAFVVLQENNALAEIDLVDKEILDIYSLGTIDHAQFGFGLDASNKTSGINIANFPIQGMFQPDAIAQLTVRGETYLFTANEGDSRDYDGYSEEVRVDDLELDETVFSDIDYWQNDYLLGRLKTTTATGDTDGDGDIDVIHSYGTRSFSIWDVDGNLVFDSGDMIEQIIANDPEYVGLFNRGNDADSDEAKNRSDDKGPEPEGVTTAMIDGNAYLFVSLERVGGVMAFNINNPEEPVFIGYHNNRDVITNGPDRGAEGMIFIDAENSPNDMGLLVLANEVSSTLSIYQINSCIELTEFEVTTEGEETAFCEDETLEIIATEDEGLVYQWSFDGTNIDGADEHNYLAAETGFYQVAFINDALGCEGKTDSIFVTELSNPTPVITVSENVLSTGVYESYEWYFEGEIIEGATEMEYTPTEDGEYTVVVINENGCTGETTFDVNFTSLNSEEGFEFTLYPNPADGQVALTIVGNNNENVLVELVDITGSTLFVKNTVSTTTLDLTELSTGVYFVRTSYGEISRSQKLIVK